MAHSFTISAFHIVFSTKCRKPLIAPDIQSTLWKYIAGIARNHGMVVLGVGGTNNHAHILVSLPPDTSLASAVRTLKSNSSRWMRETNRGFAWQEGYGAFSVSVPQLERVKHYIANQLVHHQKKTFEDEFAGLLEAANIQFRPGDALG
jgi:putative transposase